MVWFYHKGVNTNKISETNLAKQTSPNKLGLLAKRQKRQTIERE